LSDPNSIHPTFTAPQTSTQVNLKFQLTVTSKDVTRNKADEINVPVNPISTYPHPNEEPPTIKDLIKDLLKNPLHNFNSIDLSNKIIDILTDSNSNNDKMTCELLDGVKSKQVNNI
jgi:hypothetical protein